MKVYIGPYRNWVGPYQIAGVLEFAIGEEKSHKLGAWLSDTWVSDFCLWVEKKKKRNIKVRIDNYDTWGMDHTLAFIILPMLKKLKEEKHGSPFTDDEDVPENMRSTTDLSKREECDCDEHHVARWDYIMDQMIFAFESIVDNSWEDQFHKGKIDFKIIPLPDQENLPKEERLTEMVKGDNDTHEFDAEGSKAYQARIRNGLKMFGKYYQCLWD